MITRMLLPLILLLFLLATPCLAWNSGGLSLSMMTSSYPASTRQALLEKAKALDPSIASTGKGSYSSTGWSNRVGTVLTPAAIPGVYTADRPFYWNNIDVGCRMTVIELASRTDQDKPDLWIHSPVALDGPLQEAIDALGTVRHVVSPNYEHLKFASQWDKAYPDANMWACPGLMERMPEVDWAGELPFFCRPPDWPGSDSRAPDQCWNWAEIQPLHIDIEVNPVTNKPFFNEVIFYHTASKTLLTTDFYWNYPKGDGITNSNYEGVSESKEEDFGVWELAPKIESVPLGSRFWKNGMDRLYRPLYLNLMIKKDKRPEFQAICKFIVDGWDVETVIPAHGDIIRGKRFIQTVLRDFFNVS